MKKPRVARIFKVQRFLRKHLLKILVGLPVSIILIVFLSMFPENAASVEHQMADSATNVQAILDNPINAPYKAIVLITTTVAPTILAIRIVSLLVFAATVVALFHSLKHWHTKQTAWLTCIAFATNAIVLGVSRLGTPLVTVFSWFLFTSLLLWQVHGRSNKIVPGITLLAVAALLYTPGAPWFFTVFVFFYLHRFKRAFTGVKPSSIGVSIGLGLAVIAPLVVGLLRNPESTLEWLMLPDTFDPKAIYTSILHVPSSFIYKMPLSPLINVGSLPVFDLASGFLFLIGLNAYRRKLQLDRTRLMVAIALVGTLIGALGQATAAVVMLLPFAFSMIAAGVEYLLDEWNRIFPKNPFARSFGLITIMVVVLFGSYYQLTRFLIVWRQSPETREVYNLPRIIN